MDLFKTISFCILVVAMQGCTGCHNTRIEEAGKQYQNTSAQDSAIKEMQGMEDQKEKVKLPEALQGYWILTPIDSTGAHVPKVVNKSIEFTEDSVLIFYNMKTFKGTWAYDISSLNIKIKGTDRFDYSFSSLHDGLLCLQLKKTGIMECFSRLDFSKATY